MDSSSFLWNSSDIILDIFYVVLVIWLRLDCGFSHY